MPPATHCSNIPSFHDSNLFLSVPMKRFVWRLQKVLDVKSWQEQLKRTELFRIAEQLAAQRGELLLRQRILQDLMAEIARHEASQRLGPPDANGCVWGPLNAQEFFLRHAAADDEQIRRLREGITASEIRHRDKAAEVLALRRSKEGLEKLREKAKEEYIREQEKLEQKELDEKTTIAFARQSS